MSSNDILILPDGLELTPMEPTWLTTLWPMNEMTSSIGSVIMTIGIYLLIAVTAFVIAYFAKTFLPNFLKKFVPFLFVVTAIAALVSASLAFVTWSKDDGIDKKAIAVQVSRVATWLPTQGVSADNAETWNLVCFFYDGKNEYCTGAAPKVQYKGGTVKVHLEKNADGTIYLYKYADKVPLIEK